MRALYTLLQITDSLFPAGSFAHSGGLESLFDGCSPRDEALGASVQMIFERHLLRTDGLLGLAAHRAAGTGDLPGIVELDRRLLATKLPRELREASTTAGHGFLGAAKPVLADARFDRFAGLVESGGSPGNYAVAFQVAAALSGANERDSLVAWGYQSIAQMTAALMRLGLLGHRGAQGILTSLGAAVERGVDDLLASDDDTPSSFAPLLEIASMRHERQYSRLFRS